MRSHTSFFLGAIVAILLLIQPTSSAAKSVSARRNVHPLLTEIEQLHATISRVTDLLATAVIQDNEEVIAKTAALVHRVSSLVVASEKYEARDQMSEREWRIAERQKENRRLRLQKRERIQMKKKRERQLLMGGGIGSGVVEVAKVAEQAQEQIVGQVEEHGAERKLVNAEADRLGRDLHAVVTTFPECLERYLEDCLKIIEKDLDELHMEAEFIVHEKRGKHQVGYNKVVIVTDLTASTVLGRNDSGMVSYPFMWNDPIEGERRPGVDGEWNCQGLTPNACCDYIQSTVPKPDTNGNYLQCHIFVPFGGVTNQIRDDRVIINLSPDGRVHELPQVA